jgi:biotin operon repressor
MIMRHVFEHLRTRKERLISLSGSGNIYIGTLASVLDCPEASIRRSIQELRREGYHIVIENRLVTNYGTAYSRF